MDRADNIATLWARLETRREAIGMSRIRLARILGCSPSALTRWSYGKSPSAETALAAYNWLADLAGAGAALVMVELTPQAQQIVDRLLDEGLHGSTRKEVCERLLMRQIRQIIEEKRPTPMEWLRP